MEEGRKDDMEKYKGVKEKGKDYKKEKKRKR